MCGNDKFNLGDGVSFHMLHKNISKISFLEGRGMPCIVTVCDKCGLIMEHSLEELGLLNEVELNDKSK